MKITDKIEITNECNMELMARYPDNYFDLAIVDPPYGIERGGQTETFTMKYLTRNTLINCLEFQKIKLFGVLIIL